MENTPRLTASSKSSTDSGPQTPLSIDQALLQSPPFKRPFSDSVKIDLLPVELSTLLPSLDFSPPPPPQLDFSSPPPQTPEIRATGATRKRTTDANMRMRRLFNPYKYRSSFWSPEMRFALRPSSGSSRSSLTIEELLNGKDIFKAGMSQLPDDVFEKVYIAKRAFRDSTVSRLSATLRELDALEKMKDIVSVLRKHDEDHLASQNNELSHLKAEAEARGNIVDDDIAYRHAVYADEFTALACTNTQLNLMLSFANPEPTSSLDSDEMESDVVESDSLDDDESVQSD